MKDYAAIAERYVDDVIAGRILACKWVILACKRHVADVQRSADDAWPYCFNPQLTDREGKVYRPANRPCGFIELMPHVKGDWAGRGERIKLEPWQVFFLASVFGWVHKETGKRRFRQADLIVPRKNAKSTKAAGIGNYMLSQDDEFGAEIYSGATSRDQALEVFRPARLMALMSDEYRRHYGVTVGALNISISTTNSKFEPVIGNPGDGASPSCGIVDEYHEHKTDELYETLKTGMVARSHPLLLMITTAGSNIGGPCYAHQMELQRILEGVIENDRRFGIIYGIDEDDDWSKPEALQKANPNWGVSIDGATLLAEQQAAINDPRKQAIFKTKHLNVWVNSASPWINVDKLQKCGDRNLRREDFRSEKACIGLDLASKIDIASAAWVFRRWIDGLAHFYLFTRNYLPEAQISKPENAHYRDWVARGDLVATAGNMIDLEQIEEDVMKSADAHVIGAVAMDPWGSREISPHLQDAGFTVVEVPMVAKQLSDPMKTIAALIDAGRFHHDGNLATIWMFSNVEVKPDRNDNIFPRKSAEARKIDAAVATIVAMNRLLVDKEDTPVEPAARWI